MYAIVYLIMSARETLKHELRNLAHIIYITYLQLIRYIKSSISIEIIDNEMRG